MIQKKTDYVCYSFSKNTINFLRQSTDEVNNRSKYSNKNHENMSHTQKNMILKSIYM